MAATPTLDQRIAELCANAIRGQTFPGCQVGYIRSGEARVLPHGLLTYETGAPAVTAQTVYDVASITKSVPTSMLILKLLEDGRLALDDRAVDFLPELQGEHHESILIRHLLTFTMLFKTGTLAEAAKSSPESLLETIFSAPLAEPAGRTYTYTNAPSLLLGMIAERIYAEPLDVIAQRIFFEPLHMTNTTFRTELLATDNLAPTAIDWRGEVRGVVHDPSAWAVRQSGQIPGHAGLFSTASDLLTFAQMLLGSGVAYGRRFFEKDLLEAMYTNQLADIDAEAGLGWSINNPAVMGTAGSDKVFGKTGFTGTMMLMDPVKQRAVVVLSNRTYPQTPASYDPMRAFWRDVADLVFADQ